MAFEVPTDLIRQVQILLRKDAGISSYDPNDPAIPALPSLAESIAEFDPSPPYVRCKHCKGRLLRGIQSVICVYCGEYHSKDLPPEPIAFKSTVGYQWLLQSLDLDGSEILGPSIEESESKRGQRSPKADKSLSDFLNLEVAWPAEPKKSENRTTKIVPAQNNSGLNLTGVELDNFFPESKGNTVPNASENLFAAQEQTENLVTNLSEDQKNLNVFRNVNLSETVFRAPEGKIGDPSTSWEADFQFAEPGQQHGGKKSSDTTFTSAADLSVHMDSVFGPAKDLKDGEKKDDMDLFSSTNNDWIQHDPWNNTTNVTSRQAEQFDATTKAMDDLTNDNMNSPLSTSVDWIQDTHRHPGTIDAASNKTTEFNDTFDVWNDFTSSTSAQDSLRSSKYEENNTTAVDEQTSEINLFSSTDNFDAWNDFTSSTSAQDSSKSLSKPGSSHIVGADEQTSEINLFSSTNNFQDMDFVSFSEPDLFSTSLRTHNSSAEANNEQLEIPALDSSCRMVDEGNVGQAVDNGDDEKLTLQSKDGFDSLFSDNEKMGAGGSFGQSADKVDETMLQSKDKLESLFSEMHDLSFMLESNLSVPSNSVGDNSSSLD